MIVLSVNVVIGGVMSVALVVVLISVVWVMMVLLSVTSDNDNDGSYCGAIVKGCLVYETLWCLR